MSHDQLNTTPGDGAPSDQTLVAQINQGDPDAFNTLYWRYRDWVVQLAHRFTGSEDLALDVMQETFLCLLRSLAEIAQALEIPLGTVKSRLYNSAPADWPEYPRAPSFGSFAARRASGRSLPGPGTWPAFEQTRGWFA